MQILANNHKELHHYQNKELPRNKIASMHYSKYFDYDSTKNKQLSGINKIKLSQKVASGEENNYGSKTGTLTRVKSEMFHMKRSDIK